MNRQTFKVRLVLVCISLLLLFNGCGKVQADPTAELPPATKVVLGFDVSVFSVEHPEQFPIATATGQAAAPELVVTGAVNPDISRTSR